MTPAPIERLSALSDRDAIVREIGSGGMATVYLAEDLKHGRRVAIKILDPGVGAVLGWPTPDRFAARRRSPTFEAFVDSRDEPPRLDRA